MTDTHRDGHPEGDHDVERAATTGPVRYAAMTARQWLALSALAVIVVASVWVIGDGLRGDSDEPFVVDSAQGVSEFEHDYVIPAGTADRIAAGERLEIVPAELVVRVGESIRIANEDDTDHLVGLFFVGAGQTVTQRFRSEGTLEGECSVHPSGEFRIVVEA